MIELDAYEVWFLLSQFDPGFVLGFDNPVKGMLRRDIEDTGKQAYTRLIERGLVKPIGEQEMAIREDLAQMLACTHHPEHTLILTMKNGVYPQEMRYFEFGGGKIVMHKFLPSGNYVFSEYSNFEAIIEEVMAFFNGRRFGPDGNNPIRLGEDQFFDACTRISAGNPVGCEAVLVRSGVSENDIDRLLPTLTVPEINFSLTLIRGRNKPETQDVRGVGVLAGASRLWLLLPVTISQHKYFDVQPIDLKTLYLRIKQVFP